MYKIAINKACNIYNKLLRYAHILKMQWRQQMKRKWKVRILPGYWMCGTHSFLTKRAGQEFVDRWRNGNPQAAGHHCISSPWRDL